MKLLNLSVQYQSIKQDIHRSIQDLLNKGTFSEGPAITSFESQFSQSHKSSHCVALSSGTSALQSILCAVNISHSDEVIVPTNTCFPTVEAICLSGAKPVFVDCEVNYYNIDSCLVEAAITENTKAIIAVHLYGQPAQMDKLKEIANRYHLLLIEDCSQAHLASFDQTLVGNFGVAGSFSFYPTKNLGALGEAGAVVTNQSDLADIIRAFKNHGSQKKNVHDFIGNNYRMDAIQAAVLSVKLRQLTHWTSIRRSNAQLYLKLLADVPEINLPKSHPKAEHVYHQFVIRTHRRNELKLFLEKSGIETAIHYPIPCHLQPALDYLKYNKGAFPVAESISSEILSLPVAEHLNQTDIEQVASKIRSFFVKSH